MQYSRIKTDVVQRIITQHGKTASLQRPGTSASYTKTWNAAQSRYQWENTVTHVVTYVDPATAVTLVTGKVLESKYEFQEIDGTTILSSDRKFLTSDLTDPTTADKLIVGTVTLNIVSVKPLQPGADEDSGVSVTVMWTLQCRA